MKKLLTAFLYVAAIISGCKKENNTSNSNSSTNSNTNGTGNNLKTTADFTIGVSPSGSVPTRVYFLNKSTNADQIQWKKIGPDCGECLEGYTDSVMDYFYTPGTYSITLYAYNSGIIKDSLTKTFSLPNGTSWVITGGDSTSYPTSNGGVLDIKHNTNGSVDLKLELCDATTSTTFYFFNFYDHLASWSGLGIGAHQLCTSSGMQTCQAFDMIVDGTTCSTPVPPSSGEWTITQIIAGDSTIKGTFTVYNAYPFNFTSFGNPAYITGYFHCTIYEHN
jgi:hypothetical protein